MSLDLLVDIIHSPIDANWTARNQQAFDSLFSATGRYPQRARDHFQLRAPSGNSSDAIPYAAYIHPENPTSGVYSGLSFVMFPVDDAPCLIGMVVGTGGLGKDHAILGRPGHTRKTNAIARWLAAQYGNGDLVAWAKHDPTRIDIPLPGDVLQSLPAYNRPLDRYGSVLYAFYRPTDNRSATRVALAAFLDLLLEERGYAPRKAAETESETIRQGWLQHILPPLHRSALHQLLRERRFVIVQGPPGTGKTRIAGELLRDEFQGAGLQVQFHPNTTYESFIGGLAPTPAAAGLAFQPTPGALMRAAQAALSQPDKPFLLHIDEINRADLGKVLGEALFLLEPTAPDRAIELPHDFGAPFHRRLTLPPNLHILGTMNSADRSIAIVDVAVRRRFAFTTLWPSSAVVRELGGPLMQEAFQRLLSVFTEHAHDDAFALLPGHSYFLEKDNPAAARLLRANLVPLLEEYLQQGYVAGFAESVRAYLQWLAAK